MRINQFLYGDLNELDTLLEEPCEEYELRAALQNVVRRLHYIRNVANNTANRLADELGDLP